MALDPCVRTILCGLSAPVRNAIDALLVTQKAFYTAQVLAIEAQLAQLLILNLPLAATAKLIEDVIDTLRDGAELILFDPALACIDLGQVNLNMSDLFVNVQIAPLEANIREFERALNLQDELQGVSDRLVSAGDLIDEVRAYLTTCT